MLAKNDQNHAVCVYVYLETLVVGLCLGFSVKSKSNQHLQKCMMCGQEFTLANARMPTQNNSASAIRLNLQCTIAI